MELHITTVRFRLLASGPDHSHVAVEAEAVVQEGVTPEEVLGGLKRWVSSQVGLVRLEAATSRDVERLKAETAMWREYADKSRAEHEWFRQRIEAVLNLIGQARDKGVQVDEELWQEYLQHEIPF